MERALALRRAGLHARALGCYRKALVLEPRDYAIRLSLCEAWIQLGRYPEAVDVMRGATKALPNEAHAHYMTGHLLRKLCRYPEAIRSLSKALKIDPRRAEFYGELALLLIKRGDYEKARAAYEKACRIDPRRREAWEGLAEIDLWTGRYRRAAASAERALRLSPSSARALHLRGGARVMLGRYSEALRDLDAAILLRDPGMIEYEWTMPHLWKIEAERRRGKPELALAHHEATRFSSLYLSARLNRDLAHLALNGGRVDPRGGKGGRRSSRAALERSLRSMKGIRFHVAPTQKRRIKSLCEEISPKLRRGSASPVIAEMSALFRRFPDEPHIYAYRGELKLWVGRYAEARKDFARALAVNRFGPDYVPWARVGMAATNALLGEYAAGLKWCEEARSRQSVAVQLPIWEAEIHRRMGNPGKALPLVRLALEMSPSRPGTLLNWALISSALGDAGAAQQVFEKLLVEAHNLIMDASLSVLRAKSAPSAMPQSLVPAVLERSLEMLKGNRGAVLPTYVTASKQLRLVEALRALPDA